MVIKSILSYSTESLLFIQSDSIYKKCQSILLTTLDCQLSFVKVLFLSKVAVCPPSPLPYLIQNKCLLENTPKSKYTHSLLYSSQFKIKIINYLFNSI